MPISPDVIIRPLCAADRQALSGAFERMGSESRYRRFLSAMPSLSESQLRFLTEVDQRRHVALAAVDVEDGILGVARFIRLTGSAAEPAISVVDDCQGRGLGTALMARLVDRACEQGVTPFRATVLAENEPMLRLLRSIGELRSSRVGPALEVTVDL